MKKQVISMIVIALAVIGIGVGLFFASKGSEPAPVGQQVDGKSLVRDNSHMTGKKEAKVTMVEFGDYQCPACAFYDPVIKQIIDQYKNNPDFNFVFRNFPLNQLHPNAMISAEAAEAAAEQGKFWEMRSLIYEKQKDWAEKPEPLDMFVGYAQTLGLDTAKFKTAVEQAKFRAVINADEADGTKIGVDSTPTVFINGEKFTDKMTAEGFAKKINEQLQK